MRCSILTVAASRFTCFHVSPRISEILAPVAMQSRRYDDEFFASSNTRHQAGSLVEGKESTQPILSIVSIVEKMRSVITNSPARHRCRFSTGLKTGGAGNSEYCVYCDKPSTD
jgi:hypothetical protein